MKSGFVFAASEKMRVRRRRNIGLLSCWVIGFT
jgi:hypothetical protein